MAVTIFAIIYNLPRCFESYWKNGKHGITLENYLLANKTYKMVYKTWMYFIFTFLLPLVILTILNFQIIKKVNART